MTKVEFDNLLSKLPKDINLGKLESRSNESILKFAFMAYYKGREEAISLFRGHLVEDDGK